jgi:hypothetical protein
MSDITKEKAKPLKRLPNELSNKKSYSIAVSAIPHHVIVVITMPSLVMLFRLSLVIS